MKKITLSLLALAAAIAFAPAAHADTTPGWYAGAGVGANFPVDPYTRSAAGKVKIDTEDVGIDALANVGYAWPSGIRVEAQYFHNQINGHRVSGYGDGFGHIINNAIFANVLYDFNMESMFTPYIGAGIGPDFVKIGNFGGPGFGLLDGDAIVAAYQGIAGVSAQLDRNWAVTADYRYIGSWDPKVNFSGGGKGRTDNFSHNVILGVRYNFGAPTPAPAPSYRTAEAPMVAPAPTQAVPAPVAEQNFTVFFDFDKSALGPEAKRIIASAVQQFKQEGMARITITGHTDTVGTVDYNNRLSERRAAAVEEEIARHGISSQYITKRGAGKSDLLIPTADGVREAQNRRAEIVLAR